MILIIQRIPFFHTFFASIFFQSTQALECDMRNILIRQLHQTSFWVKHEGSTPNCDHLMHVMKYWDHHDFSDIKKQKVTIMILNLIYLILENSFSRNEELLSTALKELLK